MKALFKHLSAITQGEPGSVANNTSPLSNNISTPFLSTTLLAVLLGVPQVPLIGSGKVVAQTAPTCPAGTVPETVQFQANDSLQDLTQQFNIGGIDTVLTLSEEVPGQVIDRIESRFDGGVYGGLPGPNLRLNIGPGKPNRADQPGGTGNLAPGSATLTINFAQPVTLASPLTLLDVDQEGARDNNRFFRDRVAVSASNNNSNVPVNLQAIGSFTQVSGNTAFGQIENSLPDQNEGNVSITPQGPVDQISILYTPDTSEPRGQDQTIGLAPFTICAGSPAVGSIGDTVYRDNNNNNVQDQGDVGIPNVPVTLTLPGPDGQLGTGDDTTQNTTTNDQGLYTFPNLPAGNYQVTVQNPDGLTPTQTQPNPVDLQQGQNRDDVDFGFAPGQTGSIGDTVYRDNNSNNVQDDGDVGIPNVPVTLTLPGPDGQLGTGDDTTQNTTTNEQGLYTFPNLPAGNYQVTVETPDGLTPTQTQPNPVDLQQGQNRDDVDFGFAPGQPGSIGDTVYRDDNGDGTQNEGEPGIPNVEVTLINPGPDGQFGTPDDTTQTTTTDDTGNYGFPNVPPGNYQVVVNNPPDGLTPTQVPPQTVTVQPGEDFEDADFGFAPQQTGSIGDTVYRDNNNNNVQDEGDVGIPNVPVTLTLPGPDGQLGTQDDTTQNTTTNEQGIYGFPNLPAGNYTVTVETPDGLTPTQTQPNPVDLQSGQNRDDVDFGFAPGQTGSVGDTVYRDDNGDGTQNEGEPGIPNVEVTLINPGPDGQFGTPDDTTQTTTTDDNGNYGFPNVPPGNYQVVVNNPPDGLTPTQVPPQTVTVQPGEDFEDADFGFSPQQTGSIGDTVYTDTNSNNVQDDGEQGIPGATVNLTLPGPDGQLGTQDDTTQTTTTDDNGIYTFSNLPAGNYRVTATSSRQEDTPTQTQPDNIELQPGQNRDDVDFGFVPPQVGQGPGTIGDTVYNDTNRNNQQDEGETGIPGATVTLTNPGEDGEFGTPDDTTQIATTNENGNYSFPNLPAGNYRVTTTTPDGLTPTQTPPETVILAENQTNNDVDFGFAPQEDGTGSIGDTVYNDTNNNNQQDEGETGIPGVTVTLTEPGPDGQLGTQDDTTQTTTTDNNGIYGFTNLPPANYRVSTETPDGLTPTQTQPDIINLQGGQNIDTIDFGFVGDPPTGQETGGIGDTVYNDTNRNNQQDDGETGIPGVTVTLATPGEDGQLGTEDDVTTTTTTNDNGNYAFSNLPAGNYRVTINNPDGLTPTQTPPETITLADNQTNNDVDFGLAPGQQQGTGSLGDTVYRDVNGNGQQDPDEPGIPGVIVNYAGTGPDGVFGESLDDDDTSGRTQTDDQGRYTFPNLPAGTYRVTINDPSQQPIRGLTGTQTPNNPIDLDEGENFEDADFGFTEQTGTIGDTVYRDENSDGTQNEGEPGIPNVEVTLVNPGPDGQFGNGDDTTQTTTTNDQGIYSFPNVPTGNYQVVVNNPPEGLNPTQTPPSNIPLQPGQTFNDADFGFSPQQVGTIGDFVFFDNDGDSTPDNDESGIPNITLVLRDADGNEIQTTTTDEDGFYNFVAPPGTYTVTVGNPPQGLNPTLTQDNPVNLEAGQNIDTVDFGFQPPLNGSIGDTVFADENGNGIQDPGEPGVSGVVVRLIRPGEDGVFGTPDDQIEEQTTDNTDTVAFNENTPGQYTFDNLPPGDYQVQMVLPDGSILTTGSNPIPVDLQPGQNLDSADFGIRMTGFGGEDSGSIGDEVFNDTDGDGVRDEGEPGVPNVPVTLTLPGPDGQLDTSDDTTQTTNTNDQGIYTFDNLPPGPYRVSVTPPLNLPEVTNPGGSQIERDLQPGQNLDNVDFGLRGPDGGSIGDTVFNDRNGDGVQDFTDTNNNGVKDANEEGEAGIPGVQLTLRDSDGNIVATTTTNDNGNYIFNGLPLANYTVEAARPTDFSPTTETTLSAQLTEDNPSTNEVDFGFRPGRLGASGPANLRLVKRITNIIRGNASISGVTFNQFEDDPNDDDDNVIGESQVAGITRLETPVQSGDIVEYTIYFQSEGGEALQNVRVCDLIPDGTTFDSIVEVSGGGTGADSGNFLTPLTPVPAEFQNICANGTPTNGAVITNLGTLPAGGQFGFVRFRVRIN